MIGLYSAQDGTIRSFVIREGEYTTFAALGLPITFAFDINNRSQIAGTAASGLDPSTAEQHGFVLADGVDGPATQIDIPGAPITGVTGIDDRGRLLGAYGNPYAAGRARHPTPAGRDRSPEASVFGALLSLRQQQRSKHRPVACRHRTVCTFRPTRCLPNSTSTQQARLTYGMAGCQ